MTGGGKITPATPSEAVAIFIFPALPTESTLWSFSNGSLNSGMAETFYYRRFPSPKPNSTGTCGNYQVLSQTLSQGAQSQVLSKCRRFAKVKEDSSVLARAICELHLCMLQTQWPLSPEADSISGRGCF